MHSGAASVAPSLPFRAALPRRLLNTRSRTLCTVLGLFCLDGARTCFCGLYARIYTRCFVYFIRPTALPQPRTFSSLLAQPELPRTTCGTSPMQPSVANCRANLIHRRPSTSLAECMRLVSHPPTDSRIVLAHMTPLRSPFPYCILLRRSRDPRAPNYDTYPPATQRAGLIRASGSPSATEAQSQAALPLALRAPRLPRLGRDPLRRRPLCAGAPFCA
ncbi:hypothetical protein DENSPDRAFT_675403 [Dentipellis sp. KUC8613]|nr:hypothetical protein DENSPDRAFT_675403 [Dentipellis sp. KUC8613]